MLSIVRSVYVNRSQCIYYNTTRLIYIYYSNDGMSELATKLCTDLEGLFDRIKSTSSRKKSLEPDKTITVYTCCRLGLLSGQWIIKVYSHILLQSKVLQAGWRPYLTSTHSCHFHFHFVLQKNLSWILMYSE
jgi:hypothetical protein